MGLQCVWRRRETLGCVWRTVLTSCKDAGLWLRVYVGIKKESLQVGLFLWLWSLSLRLGCKSEKPPSVWEGEYSLVRTSIIPYCTNLLFVPGKTSKKTENSNLHGSELHWPWSKGTKLLVCVKEGRNGTHSGVILLIPYWRITLLSVGDVGFRRTMGLQCVLRRRETLGCVWTTVNVW